MLDTSLDLSAVFAGDLFSALGLHELSSEEKEELIATMSKTVFARVFLQVGEMLEDHDRLMFSELEVGTLIPFLHEREIDLVAMLIEEGVKYRHELILVFKTGQNHYLAPTEEERMILAEA
ncbi:hypothetical protein BH11PAT4_BH11PAT4_2790 [soil metagenome]